MAVKTRRQYAGGAASTTIGGALASSGVTTFSITSATGWPGSTTVPFYVVVSPQTASEEKMLVTLNGTTLTVVSRGVDGTTANTHASGAAIYPVITAVDLDEANELASTYAHTGAIVYQGASTFTELVAGTNDHVLKLSSGVPAWGQVATAGIADSAVTSAKIADGTIVAGDVASAFKKLVCPVGTITAFGGASAPTGWLLCNGDAIDAAHTELIALVGANTPDMKGRFPLGDNASLDLLATGGSTTIATTNLPSHTHSFSATSGAMSANSSLSHSITDSGHTHNINGANTLNENSINGDATIDVNSDWGLASSATEATASATTGISIANHTVSHTHDISGTTGSTGGATAYYQPHVVVNFIIKHDY